MQNSIIIKTGKDKYKILAPDKYIINKNTPVGDEADYYEIKPYGGKKPIYPLVSFDNEGNIDIGKYHVFDYEKNKWVIKNMPESLVSFLKEKEVNI